MSRVFIHNNLRKKACYGKTLILSLIFTSVFFAVFVQPAAPQEYYYQVNTIPLKGELVNFKGSCILQDSDGFMWFGSEDGLYRYDGTEFRIFKNDPIDKTTISSNIVSSLLEDRDGNLWIGTNRGLDRYNKYNETFTWHGHNNIWQIFEDTSGILWTSSYNCFSKFDPVSETFNDYFIYKKDSLETRIGRGILIYYDSTGYIWIRSDGLIYCYDIVSDSITYISDEWYSSSVQKLTGEHNIEPW